MPYLIYDSQKKALTLYERPF